MCPYGFGETFGRAEWHGQETMPQPRPYEMRGRETTSKRAGCPNMTELAHLNLIRFLDFYLMRAMYGVLDALLPRALSLYVVFNYAATLTLLLALTYGMIPIVAERQMRLRREESRA